MAKITKTTVGALVADDLNANKGTRFGGELLEKSLTELGAGRSILLDKNDRIIAGNKTVQKLAKAGINNVIVVETTGDEIVAVKRKDIDLDSKKGRDLAIADNATSKANLEWDQENLKAIKEKFEVDVEDWGLTLPATAEEEPEEDKTYTPTYRFEVQCKTIAEKNALFAELLQRGFACTDDY